MTQFYFRAESNSAQVIPASPDTEIVFANELFDTPNCFASNRFTVSGPLALQADYMVFYAGLRLTANSGLNGVEIQKSTNGGVDWTTIAAQQCINNFAQTAYVLDPISAGDIYRVIHAGNGGTVNDTGGTFFAGHSVETGTEAFKATLSTDFNIVNGGSGDVEFDQTEFDTAGLFNTVSFYWEAPSGWVDEMMTFFTSLFWQDSRTNRVFIQRQPDGGSWENIASQGDEGGFDHSIMSGPVLVQGGDRFRVLAAIFIGSGASAVLAAGSFFSGFRTELPPPSSPFASSPSPAPDLADEFFSLDRTFSLFINTTIVGTHEDVQTDSLSAMNGDGSIFTVPAGINGRYAILSAHNNLNDFWDHRVVIERSTNGGVDWDPVAEAELEASFQITVQTGVLEMVTGHQYRVFYETQVGVSAFAAHFSARIL